MASLNSGTFYESTLTATPNAQQEGDPIFHSAAILLPPGKKAEAPGFLGWIKLLRMGALGMIADLGLERFRRAMFEYPEKIERVKKKTFKKGEKYYYLLLTATDGKYRGKGLCSEVLKEAQKVAQAEGMPIWIEATTSGSREVYRKLGWVDVVIKETTVGDGVVIGKGKCDADGNEKRGGEGFRVWMMVWWPEGDGRRLKN